MGARKRGGGCARGAAGAAAEVRMLGPVELLLVWGGVVVLVVGLVVWLLRVLWR